MLNLTLSLETLLLAMPEGAEIIIKEVFGLGRKFSIHRFANEFYIIIEFITPELVLDKNDVIYGTSMSAEFRLDSERDAIKKVLDFLKGFNFSDVIDITIKGQFEFKNINTKQQENDDKKAFGFFMPVKPL